MWIGSFYAHSQVFFFVLDKSKSIRIRLGGQTAWEAVRNNFIENKEKIASKDYELHAGSFFCWPLFNNLPQQSLLSLTYILSFALFPCIR